MAKRKDKYLQALGEILHDETPPLPTALSRAEIEIAIFRISEELRRPLPNEERLMLVADRRDLRKQLEATAKASAQ